MCTDADAVACPAVWRWMLPRADDRGLFRQLRRGEKPTRAARHRCELCASAAFRFVGGRKRPEPSPRGHIASHAARRLKPASHRVLV